jgi:hypothetical protein
MHARHQGWRNKRAGRHQENGAPVSSGPTSSRAAALKLAMPSISFRDRMIIPLLPWELQVLSAPQPS